MPVEFYVSWDCGTKKVILCNLLVILYQVWKVEAKNIYRVRIKLSWKVKVMYIGDLLSVKFPEKSNYLEVGIWDQLSSDNSWAPRINKLSGKIYLPYYHIRIWSCDAIVCLFGVRSTWHVVWVSRTVNDLTISGVVLVLILVRRLLAWSRLWPNHEMHGAEFSD